MGVFSGLLSGLLGGGGGIGDMVSKAVNIGSKLVNRRPGESFGSALIGQLPAIAGGLGSLAKNFGGFIPGVGGIVSKIGEAVEGGAKEFEEDEPQVMEDDNYVNSPTQLLKHASNNMPVMGGLANVHRLGEPARMSRDDIDYPVNMSGNSSSNWRNFKSSRVDKIDPLHDVESSNMYASNLPHVMHKNATKAQTIDDVQPISFKRNFLR